jgi:hypothetical protein
MKTKTRIINPLTTAEYNRQQALPTIEEMSDRLLDRQLTRYTGMQNRGYCHQVDMMCGTECICDHACHRFEQYRPTADERGAITLEKEWHTLCDIEQSRRQSCAYTFTVRARVGDLAYRAARAGAPAANCLGAICVALGGTALGDDWAPPIKLLPPHLG